MYHYKQSPITINHTSSFESFEITSEGEKSSNSAAFSLARATTLTGKFANSATWIPKLWSQAPGSTWKMYGQMEKYVNQYWISKGKNLKKIIAHLNGWTSASLPICSNV